MLCPTCNEYPQACSRCETCECVITECLEKIPQAMAIQCVCCLAWYPKLFVDDEQICLYCQPTAIEDGIYG